MTRKTRRVILLMASIFFVLVVPLVIFYSLGYSFDWEKKKPVLTGGLYLLSYPEEARVYLNQKAEEQKTPVFIKRLFPGDYQVQIEKEGYHLWKKKLRIESGLVTEAKDILLVPTEPILEEAESFPVQEEPEQFFYVQKPSYILYKTDRDNSFQEQITSVSLPAENYRVVSSGNRVAAIDQKGRLYLLNSSKNLELIAENVKDFQFSNDNQKFLFLTSSEIWVLYLETKTKELITRTSQEIKEAVWYEKTNHHIVFLTNDRLKITELDGRDERNTVDILKGRIENITYDQKEEKLYFRLDDKIMRTSLE